MSFFKDIALIGKASGTIEGLEQERAGLQALVTKLEADLKAAQAGQAKTTQEKAELAAELKIDQDKLAQAVQEKSRLDSELAKLKYSHRDVEEENDLITSQLHKVQEELERYLLRCHALQQESESTRVLLNRILSDNPSYFSFEQINCHPLNGYDRRCRWTINNLLTAEGFWNVCEFDSFLEKDIAGFIFKKSQDGEPLRHWPKSYADQDELICIPTGTLSNAKHRAEVLKSLSTSDWKFLELLPEILTMALKQNQVGDCSQAEPLINALQKTKKILSADIPNELRFDEVRLSRVLVRPGYEHLNLHITNLFYGDIAHPNFEFRVGCANIAKKNNFGTDPKLEFPLLDGERQLESWYPESEDEFGAKMELRFAMPLSMDITVWEKLKIRDQGLVAGLIKQLPRIIECLDLGFEDEERALNEWKQLAINMQNIFYSNFPRYK